MSRDSIFIVRDGEPARMTAAEHGLEEHAQKLLANYPDLLGGGQIEPDDPRCWIQVNREAGVPRRMATSALHFR